VDMRRLADKIVSYRLAKHRTRCAELGFPTPLIQRMGRCSPCQR
jgi:hypothetical protein